MSLSELLFNKGGGKAYRKSTNIDGADNAWADSQIVAQAPSGKRLLVTKIMLGVGGIISTNANKQYCAKFANATDTDSPGNANIIFNGFGFFTVARPLTPNFGNCPIELAPGEVLRAMVGSGSSDSEYVIKGFTVNV